jgi:predicted nucleic acid-binding protein
MMLLDTNILSEMMRPKPNDDVILWLNQQDSQGLFISSISIAEISYGLYVLPKGKRKQNLQQRFELFVRKAFQFRLLDFNEQAGNIYGKVMGEVKLTGHPMSVADGQIAAIALAKGFTLVTRNIKDFEYSGVVLINPFEVG